MIPIEELERQLEQAGISPALRAKWRALAAELASYQSAVVAYSGGVDSSFLSYCASQVLGERMVAVTAISPLDPPAHLAGAAQFAALHGFKQVIFERDPLCNPVFQTNPPDRCYHCKASILGELWSYARQHGYNAVLEGQNLDDQSEYRPGRKAVTETGTFSPLAHNQLSKAEIRALAKAFGLSIWDKPSSPCLATRIPYGTTITKEALEQIAQAEDYLHRHGFAIVRVRYHPDLARIEVPPEQIPALIGLRDELTQVFNQIGFRYVTLDLRGYRSGSMDEGLAV